MHSISWNLYSYFKYQQFLMHPQISSQGWRHTTSPSINPRKRSSNFWKVRGRPINVFLFSTTCSLRLQVKTTFHTFYRVILTSLFLQVTTPPTVPWILISWIMRCTSASEPALGGPEWSEELRREDENGMTHLRPFCFDGLLLFIKTWNKTKKVHAKKRHPGDGLDVLQACKWSL